MKRSESVEALLNLVDQLIGVVKRVGGAALVGMMLVTCVDVIFRAFGHPIFGAVEIVSFMATIVLACAMPQTERENGHVGVDLFIRKASPRVQAVFSVVTHLASAILFGLVAWQMFLYAASMKTSGEVSMSLEFPAYYLVYLVAVAFSVLSLVILVECLYSLRRVGGAK
jgi:TRAP-type C4-dicarboxylate transport system permease small subunit